jgi:hypothetical protein
MSLRSFAKSIAAVCTDAEGLQLVSREDFKVAQGDLLDSENYMKEAL